jgi:hypothetical protein
VDGQVNASDPFPADPTETEDTDNDGIGNNADADDDNDGIQDIVENAGHNAGDGNRNGVLDSRQRNVVPCRPMTNMVQPRTIPLIIGINS